MTGLDSEAETRINLGQLAGCARHLDAHEWAAPDDVVHGSNDLDIGVEVEATVVIEYPHAGVVADEGPLAGLIGLCGIGYDIDIEVLLVPLFDFVVGEELAP